MEHVLKRTRRHECYSSWIQKLPYKKCTTEVGYENKYEKEYMHLFAVINQLANDPNLLIQSTLHKFEMKTTAQQPTDYKNPNKTSFGEKE